VTGSPSDGDPVGTLPDAISANNATSAGAARPLYRTAGPNSLPYLEYDGAAMYSISSAHSAVTLPVRVFVVFRPHIHIQGNTIFDGATANRCRFLQYPRDYAVGGFDKGDQQYSLYNGTAFVCTNFGGALSCEGGQFGRATCLFNGASSSLSMNGNTAVTGSPGAQTWTGLCVAAAGNISNWAKIDFVRLLVYDSTIVSTAAVESYLDTTYALSVPNLLMADGDSLTAGNGASDYLTHAIVTGSYPTQLVPLLGSTWALINRGVSGQTVVQMESNAATKIDVNFSTLSTNKALVAWGGTNDLAIGGSSANQAYADYKTYCSNRVAAGWKVISATLLPRSPTGISASFEADRQTVNTKIRSGYRSFSHVLADIAADNRVGDALDQNDTTYYNGDKIHLNDTGNAIMATLVNSKVSTALSTTGLIPEGTGGSGYILEKKSWIF
jgi:lysophospholipase L1-like esterase